MGGEKKQITRNRASYSCQSCRRRKVRCDKQHPRCGGCIKLDEVCVYGDADRHNSVPLSNVIDAGRKRRATEVDALEDIDSQSPSSAFGAIEQKLSQLTNLIHDISRMTPTSIDDSPEVERLDALSLSQHISRNADEDLHISTNGSLSRKELHDDAASHGSSWDKVLSKLDQLNILLKTSLRAQIVPDRRTPNDNIVPPQAPESAISSRLGFLNLPTEAQLSSVPEPWINAKDTDILAPSEEESAALFRSWLWSVYPVLPILSPVSVLEKYNKFNSWYRHGLDRGEPNPDPSFMPYIVFVWYTGYAYMSKKAKRRWFPARLDPYTWMLAMRSRLEHYLSVIATEHQASVYALAAAVSSHALAIGGQDIMKNHVSNILSIRAAQGLGIHNEKTLKDIAANEAEARRRLWWEILSIDTSISTVSGMPVVLDERYTDTNIPSELKGSCVGTHDAEEYEAHLEEPGASRDRPDDPANWQASSVVSVYHLVARARHILTVATRKVLKANMSATPMTMNELKEVRKSIQEVEEEVQKIINRVQTRGIPELEFVPATNAPLEIDHLDEMGDRMTADEVNYFLREESNWKGATLIMKHHRAVTIAFHKWSRIMLSMSLERLECISYAPFLKNSKSRLWAIARNCALRSCHGYMRKFLCMSEDSDLRMFRWAWISSSHPMHATIILLIDLHDRPHSYEASRSRAMIDKMFSLISPSSIREFSPTASTDVFPLKEGGEEAWIMLRKLRHKAWQNAGLDPDVLWTEEDQTLVGVGKPLRENDLFIRSLRENIILQHKQMKDRENSRNLAEYPSVRATPMYQSSKNQRSHPSEVTQGDRVSGPVMRDIADLESIAMVPQILLLRARNDQELMPYPVTDRHSNSGAYQNQEQQGASKDSSDQQDDEVEILHIGELIRKIQQSRRSNQAEKAPPVPQMYRGLSSQPVPAANIPQNPAAVDFRTLRSAENAIYQDIFEGDFTRSVNGDSVFQQYPATTEPHTAQSYFVNQPDQLLGQASNQHTHRQNSSNDSSSQITNISTRSYNHDFMKSNSRSSAPANPNPQANRQPPQHPGPHPNLVSANAQVPVFPAEPQFTMNPTANDAADTGTAMDIEFDWNRWDEMFGQFAGFAEMLMSKEGDLGDGSDYAFGDGIN